MTTPTSTGLRSHVSPHVDRTHALLIDGQHRAGSAEDELVLVDPGTEKVFARAVDGSSADIDRAVAAARRAFEDGRWRGQPAHDRVLVLQAVADTIDRRADEIAATESLNTGMPWSLARRGQVPLAAATFRYYANLVERGNGRLTDVTSGGVRYLAETTREPVGVAGVIMPWNAPFFLACRAIAPALAAGCAVVLKPAELTPVTSLLLGEILMESGLPDGVVNVVSGRGETAGAALTHHPDVDKIAFTGSTAVGREVVRAAAGNFKRVSLELGGKSPVVLCADADLDLAIPVIAGGIFAFSGQACSAGSRLIVHEAIREDVVSGLVEVAASLSLGHGLDEDLDLGPLVSAVQRERVLGYLEEAWARGAHCEVGGTAPDRSGYFLAPTIVTDVTPDMPIVREEVFGPVLVVSGYEEVDDAIRMANDTPYGLAGSVFTRDMGLAHHVARSVRAGRIGINVHQVTDPSVPTGGFRQSGWGREGGPEGLEEYLETKSTFLRL